MGRGAKFGQQLVEEGAGKGKAVVVIDLTRLYKKVASSLLEDLLSSGRPERKSAALTNESNQPLS
jgi:hypothetical protein